MQSAYSSNGTEAPSYIHCEANELKVEQSCFHHQQYFSSQAKKKKQHTFLWLYELCELCLKISDEILFTHTHTHTIG